jgi:hypothetical protein
MLLDVVAELEKKIIHRFVHHSVLCGNRDIDKASSSELINIKQIRDSLICIPHSSLYLLYYIIYYISCVTSMLTYLDIVNWRVVVASGFEGSKNILVTLYMTFYNRVDIIPEIY